MEVLKIGLFEHRKSATNTLGGEFERGLIKDLITGFEALMTKNGKTVPYGGPSNVTQNLPGFSPHTPTAKTNTLGGV
jgi:hypothetical protein